MNSSTRIGRAISLRDLRTLPFLAALCALEACSMWQSWHRARAPAAEVPAAPQSPDQQPLPAEPGTDGGPDSAGAAQPAAGTDALPAHGAGSGKARPEVAVSRVTRQPAAGGGSEGLSSDDVGYYMDVLQGQLTQAVGRDARIERRGTRIVLVLAVGFEVDSAQLDATGRESVRRLAEILSEYRLTAVSVQISGPDSDPQGSSARLAGERVAALSKYLTHAGVSGKRISTAGEGSGLLQADAATPLQPGVRAELQVSPIVVGASN